MADRGFLGIFIAFVVFGKRTRAMGHKLGAHLPRIHRPALRVEVPPFASAALIFIGMPLYAGAVMLGGVSFLTVAARLVAKHGAADVVVIVGLYVMMGGMKGVPVHRRLPGRHHGARHDHPALVRLSRLGGVVSAHEQLTAMADKVPAALARQRGTVAGQRCRS